MDLKQMAGIFSVKVREALELLQQDDMRKADGCMMHHATLSATLGDCTGAFNRLAVESVTKGQFDPEKFRHHFAFINTMTKALKLPSGDERCKWASIAIKQYIERSPKADRETLTVLLSTFSMMAATAGEASVNQTRSEPKYWN